MRVTFSDAEGATRTIGGADGETAMECAKRHQIEGIVGECGGAMACATCHAYLEPAWVGRLPPPGAQEREMLEGCIEVRATSRLTCQVVLTPDLDGIAFSVPASQV